MPEYPAIEGIKLISLTGQFNEPDDDTYPWKLVVDFRPPEFMQVTWALMYGGTEELVVRGMSRELLEQFLEAENFTFHPRLRKLVFYGPDGVADEVQPTRRSHA